MYCKVNIQIFTTENFWKKNSKLYCEINESGIFTTENNQKRRFLARAEPASNKIPHLLLSGLTCMTSVK